MSSIRDAIRRAERERRERQARMQSMPSRALEDDPAPTPPPAPASSAEPAPREAAPEPSPAPPSDLRVVRDDVCPNIEIPVDFTQELAYFRQGVESALPQARRSLLMTSATDKEGVTTISYYVAASLAIRDNKRTCLIDASFDSPRTSHMLEILGRPGLSDYCKGNAELSDVLIRTSSPQLYVIGVGTDNLNPSVILSSDRARTLPSELTQRFDYVLFDSGSVLGHAETSMLSGYVDGVVLVVRANRTKREVLQKADKVIRPVGVGQLGGGGAAARGQFPHGRMLRSR